MRLLLDQDVFAVTDHFLRVNGHDVVLAAELGLARAEDEVILDHARRLARVLITRDRDYGTLVFVRNLGPGVVYLRFGRSAIEGVHRELANVLTHYSQEQLADTFIVVDAAGHMVRCPRG